MKWIQVLVCMSCSSVFAGTGLELSVRFDPPVQTIGCNVEPIVVMSNTSTESLEVPDDRAMNGSVHFSTKDNPQVYFLQKAWPGFDRQILGPGETREVRLKTERGPRVCSPGEYQIGISLSEETQRALGLAGSVFTKPGVVRYIAPGEDSREAFRAALAVLKEVPQSETQHCQEAAIWWAFRENFGLVREYPRSIYAGYALAELSYLLPVVGETPEDRVRQLASPNFLSRFPTTYYSERGSGMRGRAPTDDLVRERASLIRTFLEAHPDFEFRGELEYYLGDYELVLGNYERAYEAFRWVEQNEGEELREAAAPRARAMERLRLVAAPGSCVEVQQ